MSRPPVDLKRCTLARRSRRREADGTLVQVHRYREHPRLERITRSPPRSAGIVLWQVDGEPAPDLHRALLRLAGWAEQMELPL